VFNQSIPVGFGKVEICSCVVCEVLAHPVNDFPQNNIGEEVILMMMIMISVI
jgi:hypothetical protein